MKPLQYTQDAIAALQSLNGEAYAVAYCSMRMEFCRLFQHGLVFGLNLGSGTDFFIKVQEHLLSGEKLKAHDGEPLSEYDKNFNQWIAEQRKV